MIPIQKEEQKKKEANPKPISDDFFESFFGISSSEYNQCLNNFARLHGTTLEAWGVEEV